MSCLTILKKVTENMRSCWHYQICVTVRFLQHRTVDHRAGTKHRNTEVMEQEAGTRLRYVPSVDTDRQQSSR